MSVAAVPHSQPAPSTDDGNGGRVEVWTLGVAWPPSVAAAATSRLKLGTGVTNPVTRHPAATAAAIGSVQVLSGGRAVLGIGRGDSALAHLGRAPAPLDVFQRYLTALQAYLRGEAIGFDDLGFHDGVAPSIDALGLAGAPVSSRIAWLPGDQRKVPVEAAATGPRVIDIAARLADRVMLAVGADGEPVRWAVERARAARSDVKVGAYVNVVAHTDVTVARALASGGLASFARFSVMHGRAHGPMDEPTRRVLEDVHKAYDMTQHTRADTAQAAAITDAFADRFAVVGPADHCIDRLRELVAVGLDKLVVIGPSAGADREEGRAASLRFAAEVLPAIHEFG